MAARESDLKIRLSAEERALFDGAAEARGLPTGTWMRVVAREAVLRQEAERLGLAPPRRRSTGAQP